MCHARHYLSFLLCLAMGAWRDAYHRTCIRASPIAVAGGFAGSGRVPIRPTWMPIRSASALGNPPSRKKRSAVRARGADISDNPAPRQMRPAYAACGPTRRTHRPLLERIVGVFYSGKEQRRTLSSCGLRSTTARREKHSITPNDGVLRRCENSGDTGGSVEAFVEAWAVFNNFFFG